jgi:hypothetical protein|tara:strand:+ start:69 stop:434 length:366 start_codon:yes stop_codon:yes gene_type:complete
MKNLTKQEIMNLVKEANEQELQEYFPSDADMQVRNRKENLLRYQSFVEGVSNNMIQFVEKATSDYENGIIDKADLEFLITDQCQRALDAVGYAQSALMALKTEGIKSGELGELYPINRYEQ